ncbi:hypothetical protein J6590_042845 [Homalodisca vitripennis]|nr:hypothetical protein J6590_042845 [Homalodisca vitripennis]
MAAPVSSPRLRPIAPIVFPHLPPPPRFNYRKISWRENNQSGGESLSGGQIARHSSADSRLIVALCQDQLRAGSKSKHAPVNAVYTPNCRTVTQIQQEITIGVLELDVHTVRGETYITSCKYRATYNVTAKHFNNPFTLEYSGDTATNPPRHM